MLSGAIINTGGGQHRQLMMRPDGRCYVIPNSTNLSNHGGEYDEQPVSRTYQYRKVMKPMLERKRRARINRCLDELKELMLTALQSEGENVSKLEKADILELTVRHLHKLKRQRALGLSTETTYTDRFLDGFTHCASEVSHYLASVMQSPNVEQSVKIAEPAIDRSSGIQLLQHLGSCIQRIEHASASYNGHDDSYTNPYSTPPPSPSPNLSSTTDSNKSTSPPPTTVWRPW